MSHKDISLPPFISTSDPGSFAEHTLLQRMPQIIDQIIEENRMEGKVKDEMLFLKDEIKESTIRSPFKSCAFNKELFEDTEIKIWEDQIKLYEGKYWRNVPWYFAETLFYVKILFSLRYFENGSEFYLKDPFQKAKDKELFSKGGGLNTAKSILEFIDRVDSWYGKIRALVHASLWGNRIDLSRLQIASGAGERILKKEENNLIVDHSAKLTESLLESERVTIVADNCGTELVCDLILSENLLKYSKDTIVHMRLKKYPIFVSDAMLKEVDQTLDALIRHRHKTVSETGRRLKSFIAEKRLVLDDHFFWNTPLHYTDFPEDLNSELLKQDIVILKGDVNYRRLLSDRRWPLYIDMEEVAAYFPTSFAVLRIMKSEIAVDITKEMAETLSSDDPDWLINGERGIIRMVSM